MAKPLSQGAKALATGNTLEMQVKNLFMSKGYSVMKWSQDKEDNLSMALFTNKPFISIYGLTSFVDFLWIDRAKGIRTAIECRWQQSSGTVDEKFPYVLANIGDQLIGPSKIIFIDGGGYRPEALAWLKKKAVNKGVYVFSLKELITMVNNI